MAARERLWAEPKNDRRPTKSWVDLESYNEVSIRNEWMEHQDANGWRPGIDCDRASPRPRGEASLASRWEWRRLRGKSSVGILDPA